MCASLLVRYIQTIYNKLFSHECLKKLRLIREQVTGLNDCKLYYKAKSGGGGVHIQSSFPLFIKWLQIMMVHLNTFKLHLYSGYK